MTKRLIDGAAPADEVAAEVVRLLALAPAGDPPIGAADRVRTRLTETTVSRAMLRHRLVAVIAIVLATTAVASAWVVRTAWRARGAASVMTAPAVPAAAPAPATAARLAAAAPSAVAAPVAAVPEMTVAMPPPAAAIVPPSRSLATATVIAPQARSPRPRIAPAPAVVAVDAPTPASPEVPYAVLVAHARVLLRRGDPHGALALVTDYLHATPDGPVAEEAMALAIQATLALGDPGDAIDAYLQRYPDGRFAAFAHGARDRDIRKLCSPAAIQCP